MTHPDQTTLGTVDRDDQKDVEDDPDPWDEVDLALGTAWQTILNRHVDVGAPTQGAVPFEPFTEGGFWGAFWVAAESRYPSGIRYPEGYRGTDKREE